MGAKLPDERLEARRAEMAERAAALARRGGFFVRSEDAARQSSISASGGRRTDGTWKLERVEITRSAGSHVYDLPGRHPSALRRRGPLVGR